jgi:hypothetical protein
MIEQFIAQAAEKFGIDADTTRNLTGQLLAMFRDDGDDEDFNALAEAVPGAAELAEGSAPAAKEESGGFGGFGGFGGGGGLLGGLADKAAGALGAGGIADMIGKFSGAGLDLDSAGGFVQSLVAFLKDKVGDDLVAKLASKVPGLGSLLG